MTTTICKACLYSVPTRLIREHGICQSCTDESRRPAPAGSVPKKSGSSVIVTTSMFVAGREIESEVDIISAEVVLGMNVFKDVMVGARNLVGGRSETMQKTLRDSRTGAIRQLKDEAARVGADAVIAVDLDYQEIGSSGTAMVMLVANGTAVKLKPLDTQREE